MSNYISQLAKCQHILIFLICLIFFFPALGEQINASFYFGEIPASVIKQFEKETGITVNVSTFSSNEALYAKLKTNPASGYDLILVSGYFIDRMRAEYMLSPLDPTALPNLKNIDPIFLHPVFDPKGQFSVPFVFGITGIFVNDLYFNPATVHAWKDFTEPRFYHQLLMIDDPREVFSMALMALGYSANDENLTHIHEAFLYLQRLLPNIKLFNSDGIPALMVDENATVGMGWTGDVFRAQAYNKHLHFIFPEEGYVAWVDCFAIPKNAKNIHAAQQFINFLLRPEIANQVTYRYGYATTNLAGKNLLPPKYRNSFIYPNAAILKKAQFQKNINQNALQTIARYWEQLKIG